MSEYARPMIMVTFVCNATGDEWQNEYMDHVPAVGNFVRGTPDGHKSFRVLEVWHNGEKHAPMVHGVVVFLEHIDIRGTELAKSSPDYYVV